MRYWREGRTDPDKDGQVPSIRWCVDVQEQAVLITNGRVEAIYLR